MRRSFFAPVLFLFAIGCATTDSMTTDPTTDPMAAPMGETADPASAVQAARFERDVPSDPYFEQSDTIEHEWTDVRGRRMQVAVRVSWSTSMADAAVAAGHMASNWPCAEEQARRICEGHDLTSEVGTVRCEAQLCAELTSTLFPGDASGRAGIDRVIWERLTWR